MLVGENVSFFVEESFRVDAMSASCLPADIGGDCALDIRSRSGAVPEREQGGGVGSLGSDVRDFSHGGFVVLVGAIAAEEEVANRASPSPAQCWSFGRVGVADA
jgi:hypothetical protein